MAMNQAVTDVYARFGKFCWLQHELLNNTETPSSKPLLFSGEEYSLDPFRWDFVGKNLTFMAMEGFVYFLLNLLIQYRFFLDHWCGLQTRENIYLERDRF